MRAGRHREYGRTGSRPSELEAFAEPGAGGRGLALRTWQPAEHVGLKRDGATLGDAWLGPGPLGRPRRLWPRNGDSVRCAGFATIRRSQARRLPPFSDPVGVKRAQRDRTHWEGEQDE